MPLSPLLLPDKLFLPMFSPFRFLISRTRLGLVFKLLYRHVSIAQMTGFFLANLLGLGIVLCGFQFYRDVRPVLEGGDSFMKKQIAVVTRRVSALQTFGVTQTDFSERQLADLAHQPFVASAAPFIPARFRVYAAVQTGSALSMGTEMFFEALPDQYIDADLSRWNYREGCDTLPVILPRSYLNLYNFGYARARGLPPLTEGMIGMIGVDFVLSGTTGRWDMKGRVVGFSNTLNTILVPRSFLTYANERLCPEGTDKPSRIAVELASPADEEFVRYLEANGLEAEASAADGGRTAWFLRLTVSIVMGVGLVICALAFYVLLLSIYLLLQKHTERIRTLRLIGYSPGEVALPFHVLSLGLHLLSSVLSVVLLCVLRSLWQPTLQTLSPQYAPSSLLPALGLLAALMLTVVLLDYAAVRRKVGGKV